MAFTQVALTGKVLLSNSSPAAGASVTLTLNTPITDGSQIIAPAALTARCAADGSFSLTVNANDDTTTLPTGTYYSVVIGYGSQTLDSFNVIVPHADAPTVGLFTLATLPNPNVVSPYVSQLIAGTGVSVTPAGGTGVVTVSNTSALPNSPTTYGAATFNGTSWETDLSGFVDICAEFGVSTASADNASAINTALSTLGPLGLIAYISKPGTYAVKSPIVIGNGTTSAFSTWSARLVGAGMPGGPNVTGNNAGTVETILQWQGTSIATAMFQVQGPLTGWGLRSIHLDGGPTPANAPAFAMSLTSAVRGRIENVALSNCLSGVQLTTVTARSGALASVIVDTIMNHFENFSVHYIGKSNAKAYGVLLQSGNTAIGNSCYNHFQDLWISSPGTSLGGATVNYDVYFQGCDSNLIRNMTTDGVSGTDPHWATFWDYSQINIWPAGNVIDKVDFGTRSSSSVGTASTAGTIGANSIINISAVNGQPSNPQIQNVRWGNNTYNGNVALVNGTATVTAVKTVQAGSFIRFFVVNQSGTPGNVYITNRGTGTFTFTSFQPGTTTVQTLDTSTIYYEVLNDSKF